MSNGQDIRHIIWMLGGAYLLYLAAKLMKAIMRGELDMKIVVFPVLFAVAGVILIVKGVRKMKEGREISGTPEDDDTTDKE